MTVRQRTRSTYSRSLPYWERSEAKLAIHYAKVVVDFASGLDWDALAGLPVEIQPLSRPYGLWVGNLFQGVALKDGRPLPDAVVEVEWRNDGSPAKASLPTRPPASGW